MLGLALEGGALVASAEVEDGMRCLDEATATALAGEATIPISGAWACCFLVSACTAVRDYERAADGATGSPTSPSATGAATSRLLSSRVRIPASLARSLVGGREHADGLSRGLRELATRLGRVAARRTGRAPAAAGRRARGDSSARPGGSLLRRAAVQSLAGARRQLLTRGRRARRAAAAAAPGAPKGGAHPGARVLARARTARGELDEAGSAVAELREAERLVGTAPLRACADLAEGALAAAAADHDRARTHLEDAVDGFEASGAPFEAACARIELATSLAALGRSQPAAEEAATALASLLELGAGAEAARAQRLSRASGQGETLPELTPREREVLRLLAEGLTNRQIAERLVVSEHTVHRHVANILRKLDVSSRTAAAAHAAQSGLLDS